MGYSMSMEDSMKAARLRCAWTTRFHIDQDHIMLTSLADIVLLPSLSQCYLGHCYHSTVKYIAVTILLLPPMSHLWQLSSL